MKKDDTQFDINREFNRISEIKETLYTYLKNIYAPDTRSQTAFASLANAYAELTKEQLSLLKMKKLQLRNQEPG